MAESKQTVISRLQRQLAGAQTALRERERELAEALQSAAHIQRSLIPRTPPVYPRLHFAWEFAPCKKVGGDLFNIAALDEQTIMAYLLDVSGHGLASAMVSVAVHQSLSPTTGRLLKRPLGHRPFYRIVPPHEVLAALDVEYPFERFDEFFTIAYLLFNPQTGLVRYATAGHPPPLLLRSDGSMDRLDHGGPIIGLGQGDHFLDQEFQLHEGDRLFLYTDGLTEQPDEHGRLYGEARLVAELHAQRGEPLDAACRSVLAAQRRYAGEVPAKDDVTLIGIEFSSRELRGMVT
jgi:sigma-B regulation protein RsbU (phosphoserine phosphatase)